MIVGRTFGARSIDWSLDRRRIGVIVRSIYCMHIGTIVVYVGSSTVPAIRLFGWQYNASNGVVFRRQIGMESCQ